MWPFLPLCNRSKESFVLAVLPPLNSLNIGGSTRNWILCSRTHTNIYSTHTFFKMFFSQCFFLLFSCACIPLSLQVINGQLVFSVTRGSTRSVRLRLDQVQVADGRWHDLQLELRDVRSGRETRYVATLRLDFGLFQVTRIIQMSW